MESVSSTSKVKYIHTYYQALSLTPYHTHTHTHTPLYKVYKVNFILTTNSWAQKSIIFLTNMWKPKL